MKTAGIVLLAAATASGQVPTAGAPPAAARAEPDTYLKVNRGLGYSDGKLFRGTGDAHVLGLDAATGKVLWDVSIGDPRKGESTPRAPIAWNGLVFVGNAGGDNFDVRGRVYALDANTGRTVWMFETVSKSGPTLKTPTPRAASSTSRRPRA